MGLRKEKKLRTSFIQFVVALGLFMIVLVLINYMLLVVSSLIVYPANYSERMIQHNFETLKEAEQVTGDLLTPMSSFGVYTDNGEFLYGNFLEKDTNKMWTKYNKGEKSAGSRNYMTSIKREEGVLLIKYPLTMQYKTDKLRSLLLNPEATGVILFIIELILGIVSLSNRFAKNIDKELESLLVAAGKIEEGDLEFNINTSNIKEVNIVLEGINKMKDSLKVALQEQWAVEQQKREQIAALAHDVKTPLTIVKGNVELLKETHMNGEQERYCDYIEESSGRMEKYIQDLLLVARGELESNYLVEKIDVTDLLSSFKRQIESLSKTKNIDLIWKINFEKDIYITGHREELERALMNIISNAVGFSSEDSTLGIINTIHEKQLIIQIIDQGKGFSKKMLRHGKKQFTMDDGSRTTNKQHGLGLYIADNIIKKHNGEMTLRNNGDHGGVVIVTIPLEELKQII